MREPSEAEIEAAAQAMKPNHFATIKRGFPSSNWIEQQAFLNAEKVVKRARKDALLALRAAYAMTPREPSEAVWRCVNCSAPAEGKRKPCNCATNVGARNGPNGQEQTWWEKSWSGDAVDAALEAFYLDEDELPEERMRAALRAAYAMTPREPSEAGKWDWRAHLTDEERATIAAADAAKARWRELNKERAAITNRAIHRAKYRAAVDASEGREG